MYYVDRQTKELVDMKKVSFAGMGIKERSDIQEWVRHNPEVLGEELLIIQMEFKDFEQTKERLDLLALDKSGNLVIIENKRDNSGKDAVWQIIKYASYCATFSKDDVISEYCEYVKKYNKRSMTKEDAEEEIEEFLEGNILYPTNTQRLILVSRMFDPRVLSAAEWLLDNGIDITCVRLTPYKHNNDLFLDSDIILPWTDMREYKIKIAKRNVKQKSEKDEKARSDELHERFWKKVGEIMGNQGGLFDNSTWSCKQNWISSRAPGIEIGGVYYSLKITKKRAEALLYINTEDKERNKRIYEYLEKEKNKIQASLKNYKMIWEKKEDCRHSKVGIRLDVTDIEDESEQIKTAGKLKEAIFSLDNAIAGFKDEINKIQ